jgi:hypothetical protein
MHATLNWIQRMAALALFGLCISTASAQQPSPANTEDLIARHLAAWAQDAALMDQMVDSIYGRNLSAEKRALVKGHFRSFLRNERLPAYLVRVMRPVASPTLTEKEAQAFLVEGMAWLKEQGQMRLPTERKAQFVRFSIGMMTAVPARACKAIALGELDRRTESMLEILYSASLPTAVFERHLALVHETLEAGLAESADVKAINKTQAQAAERAFGLAFQARASRLPAGLQPSQDLAASDPAEVCLLTRESLAAGLDLSEPYRGWWLSSLLGATK